MSARPHDTSPEAWAMYCEALDRIGPAGRLEAALEMGDALRAVRLDGLRARFPGHAYAELIRRLVLEEYGIVLPIRP